MNSISTFQSCSVFSVVYILFRKVLYVPFSRFFVKKGAPSRILKMQNKPKFQITKILLTAFTIRGKKDVLRTPQPKNKPKQTQIKDMVAPASSLRVTPASNRRKNAAARTARMSFPRKRESSIKNYPPSGGFRIFDIYILIFDMLCYDKQTQFPKSRNDCKSFSQQD